MKPFVRFMTAFVCSVLFAFALSACEAENMGSLKDVSRPYTGLYECEKISLGDRDMSEKFEKITLELKQDGTFELVYATKEGNEGRYFGNYSVETEKEEITFSAKQGARVRSIAFPYEKGTIRMDYNLFGTLVYAEFRLP